MENHLTKKCNTPKVASVKQQTRNFVEELKGLKLGQHFIVGTEAERQTVLKEAKTLKKAGVLKLSIITRRDGEHFKVAAI